MTLLHPPCTVNDPGRFEAAVHRDGIRNGLELCCQINADSKVLLFSELWTFRSNKRSNKRDVQFGKT